MITGTREWSMHSANLYRGCFNNCKYCYARVNALRFKQIINRDDWSRMVRLQEPLRYYCKVEGTIMFPTTHDIFQHNLPHCLHFLRNTLRVGNRILIVSKPRFDCIEMLCRQLEAYKKQILFRFTIGSMHNDVLKFWEPNAPRYEERLACLTETLKYGYETSVSVEPMLDQDMEKLYWELEPYVTDAIWFGKMNRIEERVDTKDWSEEDYAYLDKIKVTTSDDFVRMLYNTLCLKENVKWKESIKQVIGLPLAQEPGMDE